MGGVVGAVALPVVLPLVGFTATGVAAGSAAASVQSVVYGAFTTGVFRIGLFLCLTKTDTDVGQ